VCVLNPTGFEWVKDVLPSAVQALLQPSSGGSRAGAISTDAVQISAASASLQAMSSSLERVLQLQTRANSRSGTWLAVLLGAPLVAGGLALYHYGWATVGWVSMQQLKERLAEVKASLSNVIAAVKAELFERFAAVDEKLGLGLRLTEEVRSAVDSVQGDVQQVGDAVASLERRMESIEGHSKRSAAGVELLCEFVAQSPLLTDCSSEMHARLQQFSGSSSSGMLQLQPSEARERALSSPPLIPPPPAPLLGTAEPQGAPKGLAQGALRQEVPEFLRSVLSAQSVV